MDLRKHIPTLSEHPVEIGHRTEGAILSELVRRVRGYDGDADIFLVHCRETGRIYSVPVEKPPAATCTCAWIRRPNGQMHGVRWGKDYELPA